MTVTIREIAEKAGVSRGTVDRVLNGRQRVKPEVRKRVLEIAEQLNYIPNVAAKALALSKNPVRFGIVMPPKHISFFDEIRIGIDTAAEELRDLGIKLDYHYVDNKTPEEAAAVIRMLLDSGANGILYAAMDDDSIRAGIDQAAGQGVPVVTFNSDVEHSKRICFVGQDLQKSGKVAAGLMCRILTDGAKVAIVTGSLKFQAHRARVMGFKEGMNAAGKALQVVRTIEGFDLYAETFAQLDEVLKENRELEGIYMATGSVAACLEAVKRHGRAGKIRIVCNDLTPEVEQGLRERIVDFTIVQNPQQQGYRALRILYDYIFTKKSPPSEFCYTDTHIYIPESL